jgi:dolichol-phosphate mannosyltransferase
VRGTLVALASPGGGTWSLGSSPAGRIGPAVDLFTANGRARTFALAGWNEIRRAYVFGALGALLAVGIAVAGRLGRKRRFADARSDAGRLWVVLPTYNEARNLAPMVEQLLRVFDERALDGTILVVDDASPDGTGRIADELAAANPAVHVLHRSGKSGIGRAYVDGFAVALRGGADVVVQMDCDFSHDPADVPRLVEALAQSDVVLGSRYVRGGRVERWGLGRRTLSRLGCLYAQCVLGVGVRDLTGGFKCFRAVALGWLSLDSIGANGYAFQIETTYRALAKGLVVHEVPITFRDRTVGESKMSWRIAAEAVTLVPRLRLTGGRDAPARGRLARREPGRPELTGAGVEVGKQRTQVV